MTTLPVMEKKRNVLGEPVQTFQDAMCKPSAQPRDVAVFTVLHALHLCLSDGVRVKSLQASVLRRNAAARVRRSYCFSVSSDHVSALLVMLGSICKHFFWLPTKKEIPQFCIYIYQMLFTLFLFFGAFDFCFTFQHRCSAFLQMQLKICIIMLGCVFVLAE